MRNTTDTDLVPVVFSTVIVAVVLFFVLALAYSVGASSMKESITEDCRKMGSFRINTQVYECRAK